MKIAVCVKQVSTLGDEVELTPDERDVDPDLLERSLNEWDTCATEEALRLREAAGEGEVLALTVGDEESEEGLRRCLAMGADRAIRIAAPSGVMDPLTVARGLASALQEERPDLVLSGVQSSDSVQAATGTMLAELLGLPVVAVVVRLAYRPGDSQATVQRELEGGLIDLVEVALPALLTIQTGINEPRYATLRAIKQASQQEIAVVELPQDVEPCYRVRRMFAPPRGERAEMLGDDPAEVARRIADLVKARLA
jgi:electron transfer flavoprotein beta subunit